MTKSVALGTIEHGLREAFQHLGLPKIVDVIEEYSGQRKSQSLLRKYADPDETRHHLPMRDALAIDHGCCAEGHKPPLLEVYSQLLNGGHRPDQGNAPPENICHLALAIDVAAAMVSEAILQSETCSDCGCHRNFHSEQIYARLLELEKTVATLRSAIVSQNLEKSV